MLIKEEFLKKYNIAENEFRSANIRNWNGFIIITVPWSRNCVPSAGISLTSISMTRRERESTPTVTG